MYCPMINAFPLLNSVALSREREKNCKHERTMHMLKGAISRKISKAEMKFFYLWKGWGIAPWFKNKFKEKFKKDLPVKLFKLHLHRKTFNSLFIPLAIPWLVFARTKPDCLICFTNPFFSFLLRSDIFPIPSFEIGFLWKLAGGSRNYKYKHIV